LVLVLINSERLRLQLSTCRSNSQSLKKNFTLKTRLPMRNSNRWFKSKRRLRLRENSLSRLRENLKSSLLRFRRDKLRSTMI